MLTVPQTVGVHFSAAAHKVELLRTTSRFLVSAMFAGMWIGVEDVLMWSAGGQSFVQDDPATSAMMVLPLGALGCAISWKQAGVAHDFWASYLEGKIEHTPVELFWRGVMCNVLVSCAVWAAARLKSEVGKAIIIIWCVLGFVASGFEHVVANMTTFPIGLLGGGVDVTWGDFGVNMLSVGAGNLVGGAVVIGFAYAYAYAYAYVAGKADAHVEETVDA